MVTETLIDLVISIMLTVGDTITMVPLPVAMMDVLFDFLCYGTWIIGADYMMLFMSVVVSWFVIRFTLGLVIFLWELLPLT